MRGPRRLPLVLLAAAPFASPTLADDILPGPPTAAPEVFSMSLTGGAGGLDMRFTLYADRTFGMEDGGVFVLTETVEPEVYGDFLYALRTSGFLALEPQGPGRKKAGDLVVSLSAYGGVVSYAYPANAYASVPLEVEDVQAAFEYLVVHVLVTSGAIDASGEG